jgi:triphosphatase
MNRSLPGEDTALDRTFAAHLAAALGRIEANVRGAREGRDPESLHQMRVGLRRLRAALQAFRALPGRKQRRRLGRSARQLTRGLGAARDWDVLIARLEPTAGSAELLMRARRERAAAQRELRRLLSSAPWRDFLASARRIRLPRGRPRPSLTEFGRDAMERARRKAMKRARRMDWESATQRHALRVRLKRLRYTCEIFSAPFPARAAAAYVGRLEQLQDILGELNDLRVNRALLRPDGSRGHGMRRRLAAREAILLRRLRPAWRAFEASVPFWRPRG